MLVIIQGVLYARTVFGMGMAMGMGIGTMQFNRGSLPLSLLCEALRGCRVQYLHYLPTYIPYLPVQEWLHKGFVSHWSRSRARVADDRGTALPLQS